VADIAVGDSLEEINTDRLFVQSTDWLLKTFPVAVVGRIWKYVLTFYRRACCG